jgi:uncharacterized protein DUF7008/Eco57I restriction-modification methylase
MTAGAPLTSDAARPPVELAKLQRMVTDLVDDLRENLPGRLREELYQEWTAATTAKRTAATFETWRDDLLDQAAVAWVLGCVFVRFCEDNRLVDGLWIGGPNTASEAADLATAYRTEHYTTNERDWIRLAFAHLGDLPGTRDIFDRRHNPVWRFHIPGESAMRLLDQFRRGIGIGSLADPALDTRFLGDLYQDLSVHAKKTYALLQTPEFVQEFILDRAFEPAVAEFGLADTKVIDPACGSGHFILGAFRRLIDKWQDARPAADIRQLTQTALNQVTGVDINPFAIAIARFRLLVAALEVCELSSLESSPDFQMRLAAGDSLLRWGKNSSHQGDLLKYAEGRSAFAYFTENGDRLAEYLQPGRYTVVLANPPYVTVADPAQNEAYRALYPKVCYRQYQLTVPFAQRLFELARRGNHDGYGAGWVGQIAGNAFMKREFGRNLVNWFYAREVDLSELIDTSGAYIPGHGTPTMIIVGRARMVSPRYSGPILSVLGVRGEPSQPEDAAKGSVWSAIIAQIDDPGSESDWVTVQELPRYQLAAHPWNLAGGGSGGLLQEIEAAPRRLAEATYLIGYTGQTNADGAFLANAKSMTRYDVEPSAHRQVVVGDVVRDFSIGDSNHSIFAYNKQLLDITWLPGTLRRLWPLRTTLWERRTFGKLSYKQEGRAWWEWHQVALDRLRTPLSIAFAFVATHNHFALDRGGKVFNRSAPVIKLTAVASAEDHLRLLGVLNSSTGCFWLKQVSQNKGNGGIGGGIGDEAWEPRYEFTGTKLKEFPLPATYPLQRARELDRLAQELAAVTPVAVAAAGVPTREALDVAKERYRRIRARMIAVQEELDWEVYRLYRLVSDDLTTLEPPQLALGERAFEIVLARKVAAGEARTEWFSRHGSKPITELPPHWTDEYRALVEKRIAVIEGDRNIGLIERPEYKRRWQTEGWDPMRQVALRDWLMDRLEAPGLWGEVAPLTVAQLADRVRHDEDFQQVLTLWVGNDQYDPAKALAKLVADEHVPYLPAQRYKPSGLRKRVQWEKTWSLQRREDAGETVRIPVPPRYASADFVKTSYWRNRGKLDVPKERFISYPNASPDVDGSLLLGWAGWDHVLQAQALAGLYLVRQEQQWPRERLLPLLAGLAELEPWLRQWHAEPRDDFQGVSPAEYIADFVDGELSMLDADRAALDALRGLTGDAT